MRLLLLALFSCGVEPELSSLPDEADLLPTSPVSDLVPDAVGQPSFDASGQLMAVTARTAEGSAIALCHRRRGWECQRVMPGPGTPDRPALSPDGRRLAFAWAGPTGGLVGLYVMPAEGGDPLRVTNTDVHHRKDGPPEGWLPLPEEGSLRWEGSTLLWDSQGISYAAEAM